MTARPPTSRTTRWLLSVALVAAPACDDAELGNDPDTKKARRLLRQVRDADYQSWERPPGWGEDVDTDGDPNLVPSDVQHGDFVEVYLNDVVIEALAADKGSLESWPVDAVIVLDGWYDDARDERATLSIMKKREEGWYFEEYTGRIQDDSVPAFAGQHPDPDICVGCHRSGNDFVRTIALP